MAACVTRQTNKLGILNVWGMLHWRLFSFSRFMLDEMGVLGYFYCFC